MNSCPASTDTIVYRSEKGDWFIKGGLAQIHFCPVCGTNLNEAFSKEQKVQTRILLVDDSPLVLRAMDRMLGRLGYHEVSWARDGAEAIKAMKKFDYDVVISDIDMPTPGIKVLEAWRKLGKPDSRFAFHSGSEFADTIAFGNILNKLADKSGPVYFRKPVSIEDLKKFLEE